jgi:hypothetical protein
MTLSPLIPRKKLQIYYPYEKRKLEMIQRKSYGVWQMHAKVKGLLRLLM